MGARTFKAITPHNSNNMAAGCERIYVGGAGNIAAVDRDGTVTTFAVTAGQIIEISPVRINATGTTATGLVGLY